LTLEQLFLKPPAAEFFQEHRRGAQYRRPMIIQLAIPESLAGPSGEQWPPPLGASSKEEEEPAWVRRAAQLAAAASSGSDAKAQKRLVVVNPGDVERKAANPELARALAAPAEGLPQAFSALTQRQLVAVRDVHTDEDTGVKHSF
jgi:hypothetical protein